jgi:hypothetical protein
MRKVCLLLLPAAFFLLLAADTRADPPGISYLKHLKKEDRLETTCALTGELSFDIVDAIRNGLTARLSLVFQLSHAPGPMGMGKQVISERSAQLTISYDVWDNSFIIESRRGRGSASAGSPQAILGKVSEEVSPVSFRLPSVEQDERLVVRGKIKVQTVKLFPPFGLFLVFYDPWNFDSGWIQSDPFTLNGL